MPGGCEPSQPAPPASRRSPDDRHVPGPQGRRDRPRCRPVLAAAAATTLFAGSASAAISCCASRVVHPVDAQLIAQGSGPFDRCVRGSRRHCPGMASPALRPSRAPDRRLGPSPIKPDEDDPAETDAARWATTCTRFCLIRRLCGAALPTRLRPRRTRSVDPRLRRFRRGATRRIVQGRSS